MPLPIFGKQPKNPADVVRSLKEALVVLESKNPQSQSEGAGALGGAGAPPRDKKQEKAQEDLSKHLQTTKSLLLGSDNTTSGAADTDLVSNLKDLHNLGLLAGGFITVGGGNGGGNQSDIIVAQLSQEVYNSGLLLLLLRNLHMVDFEGKKDAVQVFNNLLRRQIGTRTPTVEYICTKPEIVFTLCRGYEHQEIALNCGAMLRECVRYEALAKILLQSEQFYDFFKYVEVSTFDIASDAFATFKDLLTRHKMLSAEFLEGNYERIFENYQKLLHSDNYVTRRQSLKLLGELLLDRHNFSVMTKYISSPDNLKLMMNLLKEKARNIQFEAFHVFKVFVANPNKPKPILDILIRNREKLIDFLSNFHNDRSDDEQFNDEKAYLIKQIQELKQATPVAVPSANTTSE